MNDNKCNGDLIDEKILAIVVEVLEEYPELGEDSTELNEAFDAAVSKALKRAGIALDNKRGLKLCSVWCAQHGNVVIDASAYHAYKRALDHQQSIPGLHSMRMLCIDP